MKILHGLIFIFVFYQSCSIDSQKTTSVKTGEDKKCDIMCTNIACLDTIVTCVTEVVLREKKLTIFPIKLQEFTNLKSIDLSFNYIDTIPSWIGDLDISYLNLSHGNISYISPEIGKLQKLESLVLLFNNLTSIPKELCNCKRIRTINLNGNAISKLPNCIVNMPNIKTISIENMENKSSLDLETIDFFNKNLPKGCNFYYD